MRRTVVVHDWVPIYGGAERVTDEIATLLEAELLYASCVDPRARREMRFEGPVVDIASGLLGRAFRHTRAVLPLLATRYEQLNLVEFDLIVSSSYAVAKGVRAQPEQLYISYVHSPMRYVWDMEWTYLARLRGGPLLQMLAARWIRRMREWDFRTTAGIDHIVTNSTFVARRIWRAWRRRATVIHPPVEVDEIPLRQGRGEYYITVCRLVPYKYVDVLVETFRHLPRRKLIVVSRGPELKRLRRHAPPNVTFTGYVSRRHLLELLCHARGFLYAAEEDFGIAMAEAQAAGVPVIAYARGGALDIVCPRGSSRQPTGILVPVRTPSAFAEAVRNLEDHAECFSPEACRENALRFHRELFRCRFKGFIAARWERHIEGLRRGCLPREEEEEWEKFWSKPGLPTRYSAGPEAFREDPAFVSLPAGDRHSASLDRSQSPQPCPRDPRSLSEGPP